MRSSIGTLIVCTESGNLRCSARTLAVESRNSTRVHTGQSNFEHSRPELVCHFRPYRSERPGAPIDEMTILNDGREPRDSLAAAVRAAGLHSEA